jgi:hypothetical protein
VAHADLGRRARAVASLDPSKAVARLNGLSVLCGTLAVMLICRLSVRLLRWAAKDTPPTVRGVCARATALFFAVSTPVWIASTRANPLILGVVLMMTSVLLLIRYASGGRVSDLVGYGFVYGVGLVEGPPFLLLALPNAMVTGLQMWRRSHLRPCIISVGLAAVGVGLLGFLLSLRQTIRSPALLWIGDASGWELTRAMLASQVRGASAAVPKTGWLLILLVMIVPWLMCVVETRRRRSTLRRIPSLILYTAMLIVSALM